MARSSDIWTLWWETAVAANAAAATIMLRTARIQTALLAGDMRGGPETHRMVAEKVKAVQDGYLAWLKALPATMAAPYVWSGLTAEQATGLALAFARPGMRKARANARRLTRSR